MVAHHSHRTTRPAVNPRALYWESEGGMSALFRGEIVIDYVRWSVFGSCYVDCHGHPLGNDLLAAKLVVEAANA